MTNGYTLSCKRFLPQPRASDSAIVYEYVTHACTCVDKCHDMVQGRRSLVFDKSQLNVPYPYVLLQNHCRKRKVIKKINFCTSGKRITATTWKKQEKVHGKERSNNDFNLVLNMLLRGTAFLWYRIQRREKVSKLWESRNKKRQEWIIEKLKGIWMSKTWYAWNKK